MTTVHKEYGIHVVVQTSHSGCDVLVHGHEYSNYDQLNVTPWLQLKYLLMIFMSMYKDGCDIQSRKRCQYYYYYMLLRYS